MRSESWCLRLTKHGWFDTYRTYLALRDGIYLDQTPHRGGALRFDSETDAVDYGQDLVRAGRCIAYEVEYIPADPVERHSIEGTGGAA